MTQPGEGDGAGAMADAVRWYRRWQADQQSGALLDKVADLLTRTDHWTPPATGIHPSTPDLLRVHNETQVRYQHAQRTLGAIECIELSEDLAGILDWLRTLCDPGPQSAPRLRHPVLAIPHAALATASSTLHHIARSLLATHGDDYPTAHDPRYNRFMHILEYAWGARQDGGDFTTQQLVHVATAMAEITRTAARTTARVAQQSHPPDQAWWQATLAITHAAMALHDSVLQARSSTAAAKSTDFIQVALDALDAVLPGLDPDLGRLYALLVLTKGEDTTTEDVHNAWAMWRVATQPDHPDVLPYHDLPPHVRAEDQPYLHGVHEATRRLNQHQPDAETPPWTPSDRTGKTSRRGNQQKPRRQTSAS